MDKNKTKGLKLLTRAGSGGKELVRDNTKSRKYRVRGE